MFEGEIGDLSVRKISDSTGRGRRLDDPHINEEFTQIYVNEYILSDKFAIRLFMYLTGRRGAVPYRSTSDFCV